MRIRFITNGVIFTERCSLVVSIGRRLIVSPNYRSLISAPALLTCLESLRDYFSQFGEVTECTVMRDGATGRSRGFGFLTFKDPKNVNTVMVKEHYLDGKIVWLTMAFISKYSENSLTNGLCRLTPRELFLVMSRRRRARSLWAASARTQLRLSSRTTSLNLAALSMQPL